MRSIISLCGVAAAVGVGLAGCASTGGDYSYQTRCQRMQQQDRAVGTAVGAAAGALAGSAIAGNSSNTEGAVIGGVAGAIIGNQVAKGRDCPPGYYAY